MKLSALFVILTPILADIDEKRKGGRKPKKPKVEKTPEWRMKLARGYYKDWQSKHCCTHENDENCIRPNRCANLETQWDRIWANNERLFEKCGYYNKDIRNGGPRPKERRRRSDDDDDVYDLYDYIENNKEDLEEGMEYDDGYEDYKAIFEDDDDKDPRFKLKTEPYRAFKQISNAAKQWIRRYLQDCKNENTPRKQDKRSTKKRKQLKRHLVAFKEIYDLKDARHERMAVRTRKLQDKQQRQLERELNRS